MRFSFIIGALVAAVILCSRIITTAVHVVYDVSQTIVMAPFRIDYGVAREFIDRYVLSAFRVIGLLKPEYEASLDTDGQSHLSIHRLARQC